MKSKFYLAAALTMSLAACTNEDVLLSQEGQDGLSPIKFALEVNDGSLSRNVWGSDGVTVQWDKNTHLSLFHGGQEGYFGTSNAIYKANDGSSDGKLSFSTQSMVLPGQAIMVHPADTTFEMMGGNLYVKAVENVAKTGDSILHRLPFISEGINIGEYNKDSNRGAGYGKEYDVKLRQIGSLLQLKFQWEGYDEIQALLEEGTITQGITIDEVTLNRPTDKFNTRLQISLTEGVGKNWSDVDTYGSWNMASIVDVDNPAKTSASLSSKDFNLEKNVVSFMLLPQYYVSESEAEPTTDEAKVPSFAAAADDASIVIETYYGTLTLDKDRGTVFPEGSKYDPYFYTEELGEMRPAMTVSEGLNHIVAFTNLPKLKPQKPEEKESTFLGEIVGQAITRLVNADLAYLDMSTVHIKNEEHLLNVLHVHEAIQPGTDVKLTIDGDENKEFVMSTQTVAWLNELNADEEGVITLSPCKDSGEQCTAIRLTGGGEVPQYSFVVDKNVKVILDNDENAWEWNGGIKTIMFMNNFENQGTLEINGGAEVKFKGLYSTGKFINKGTINVNGEVKQSVNTVNHGTITVKAGAEYYSNANFINEATGLDTYGTITNNGVFGNINDGIINNYGLIVQNTAKSKTFITSNQTDKVLFSTPWSSENKYGTIKLYSKDDTNYSVSNKANEGFIMIETTAATVTEEEIGKEANYVKVAGACTTLDFTRTATVNTRVLFIEIASSEEVVWNTEKSLIRGLIVPAGKKLYIKKDNAVELSEAVYLKGKIYKGGEFTPKSFISYFGNAADATTDIENVIKWAN